MGAWCGGRGWGHGWGRGGAEVLGEPRGVRDVARHVTHRVRMLHAARVLVLVAKPAAAVQGTSRDAAVQLELDVERLRRLQTSELALAEGGARLATANRAARVRLHERRCALGAHASRLAPRAVSSVRRLHRAGALLGRIAPVGVD